MHCHLGAELHMGQFVLMLLWARHR